MLGREEDNAWYVFFPDLLICNISFTASSFVKGFFRNYICHFFKHDTLLTLLEDNAIYFLCTFEVEGRNTLCMVK